jgi:hypothetical protein
MDIQHNSIECHYAECSYAECHDYLNDTLSVVMLNVFLLSITRLNVVMLSVIAPANRLSWFTMLSII